MLIRAIERLDSADHDRPATALLLLESLAPIVGATRPQHLQDAIAALDVELTTHEVEALEPECEPHRCAASSDPL